MLGIRGDATYFPEDIRTTTKDFSLVAKHFKTRPNYVQLLTGVIERSHAPYSWTSADLALKPAKEAIEKAGLGPKDIGLMFHCSVYGPAEPASAMFLSEKLGLRRTVECVDIKNACHGFVSALYRARDAIQYGTVRHVLITTGELGSRMAPHAAAAAIKRDRRELKLFVAGFTLGDFGGAWVVSHAGNNCHTVLRDSVIRTDSSFADKCTAPTTETPFEVDAAELQQGIFPQALDTAHELLDRNGVFDKDVGGFIVHQTSAALIAEWKRSLPSIAHLLKPTYETRGNLISGSLPSGFADCECPKGKKILACIQGGGAVFSSLLFERITSK